MPRPQAGSESQGKKTKNIRASLEPATRHGLVVVLLFTLALIFILSYLNLAGLVGEFLSQGLRLGLGWAGWAVPVVLLAVGYALLQLGHSLRSLQWIGLTLLILGLTGLFHSTLPASDRAAAAAAGGGGGYLGHLVLYPLGQALGLWGAIVLLVAVTIGGTLILFETSLASWLEHLKAIIDLPRRLWSAFSKPAVSEPPLPPTPQPYISSVQERELSGREHEFQPRLVAEPMQPPLIELKTSPRPRAPKIQVPLDLLEERIGKPTSGDIQANQDKIQRTLQNFGIEVTMGGVNVGPTVTQYTLAPAEGVKLASITALSNDLALALAAHPIRIEAPIPGQSLVGIEVPNQTVATVGLKDILRSDEFKHRRSNLTAALGKDVAGKPWVIDIERMPHLLIAGATGSGKSVCINSILLSLLYTNSPDELKLIIVDPKRVELSSYNDVPHLLTPVVIEVNKTINALKWVVGEMDRRYHVLSRVGKRNLQSYNQSMSEVERLPFLVVVIDELADLMAVAAADVEAAIIRLAQMARAVGIHLVVATQRPSVDVITGLIKANITARIAFAVASAIDSRTILDSGGAEKLLGRGDCLFVSAELSKPKRLQAAFVGDAEIESVTNFLKEQAEPDYHPEVVAKQSGNGVLGSVEGDLGDDDELLSEAKILVVRTGKASASFLQRRLRVGYARAARLLDLLEERGIIGPGDGAKPRDVLVSQNDIEQDFATMPEEALPEAEPEEPEPEDESKEAQP